MSAIRERLIHIRSKDADCYYENKTSGVHMTFNSQITCSSDEYFKISLVSFVCPYTWYNINERNNRVYVVESDEDGSNPKPMFYVEIGTGNYNILQVIQTLQDELNAHTSYGITYSISYSTPVNKITIQITTLNKRATFDFTQLHTSYEIIGFTQDLHYATSSTSLTSDSVVNVQTDDVLYIRSSFTSDYTIDSQTKTNSNILQKIEVHVDVGEFAYIDNFITPIYYYASISAFDLWITDENGDLIDLNNKHWTCSLLVQTYRRNEDFRSVASKEQEIRMDALKEILNEIEETE